MTTTTTEIETLARRLAQCAKPGGYHVIVVAQRQFKSAAVCVSPEDTERILGHLDNVDRQLVLDRSADIVAANLVNVT